MIFLEQLIHGVVLCYRKRGNLIMTEKDKQVHRSEYLPEEPAEYEGFMHWVYEKCSKYWAVVFLSLAVIGFLNVYLWIFEGTWLVKYVLHVFSFLGVLWWVLVQCGAFDEGGLLYPKRKKKKRLND